MSFPKQWDRTIDIKGVLHDDRLTLKGKADAVTRTSSYPAYAASVVWGEVECE